MYLQFNNISKSFGIGRKERLVLNDVSWSANAGEVHGLLGPNGAGKTTLIKILLGLIPADRGTVLVDSGKINPLSESFRNSVGYMPEERVLEQQRNVVDIISHYGILKGLSLSQTARKVKELLGQFDLNECKDKAIHQLSKGQAQRVQLASALIHQPSLLIMDEPFYGLDPLNTQLLRDVVRTFRQHGALVVLCTHQMSEVDALCDRITLLNKSQVVLSETIAAVREKFTDARFLITTPRNLNHLPSVEKSSSVEGGTVVELRSGSTVHSLLYELAEEKVDFKKIERHTRPLEDIFIELTTGKVK
jgi:ABC-2 type transport system ATP-binding protein